MAFTVGETVVYPNHGAAVIEDIETRTIKGEEREYLVLTTETRNAPARAYYTGLGFEEESVNFVIRSEVLR